MSCTDAASGPTSMPDLTNALVVELANHHSNASNVSSGKFSQKKWRVNGEKQSTKSGMGYTERTNGCDRQVSTKFWPYTVCAWGFWIAYGSCISIEFTHTTNVTHIKSKNKPTYRHFPIPLLTYCLG